MKTMKNVLMILLGAALVLSLAGVGGAAEEQEITWTGTQSGELKVTYTIGESCSFTIPTEVSPGKDEFKDAAFSVDSAILGSDSMLVVKITSNNGWKMKLDENNVIPYTMKYNGVDVTVDGDNPVTICEITKSIITENDVLSPSLSFKINDVDLPTVAGEYTDTLTFTVTPTSTSGNPPADQEN